MELTREEKLRILQGRIMGYVEDASEIVNTYSELDLAEERRELLGIKRNLRANLQEYTSLGGDKDVIQYAISAMKVMKLPREPATASGGLEEEASLV